MSFQRISHSVFLWKSKENPENEGAVSIEIKFKGTIVDRSEALVVIADALITEMINMGLDPEKTLANIIKEMKPVKGGATH